MDFTFDEEQVALRQLAARLLSERVTQDRLKEVEAVTRLDGGDGVDRTLWADLAGTGLLAAPLAEENGGAGLGFLGAAVVVEEIGRRVAPVPYLECVAVAGLAIERFGSAEVKADTLAAIGEGTLIVTSALVEEQAPSLEPTTTATAASGGGWLLSGSKICVAAGIAADRFLVPATFPDGGTGVAVVHAGAAGVSIDRQETTLGRPEAAVRLDSAEVPASAVLGGADAPERNAVLSWLVEHTTAALCVLGTGCYEEATRLTAEYVKERKQFERPLATFQAVGQRAADAYIDSLGVRLTAWQAVWRLAAGLPATDEVTIAKYWASEGGQRVVHAAQHLHGGVGMDRDYPLHRYFLLGKQIALSLGGAAPQLAELGKRIAASA
jgi:acyl-CoA dehydrogenase